MNKQHPFTELVRKCGELGSQEKLAEWLGISPQYTSDILNGRRKISERIGSLLGFEKIWRKKQ
jgi:DNA-binding transcriptional regulator YdaS (Cro superfamily)